MHRFSSASAVRRVRITALLLCAKCLLVPAAGAMLVYGISLHDIPRTKTGLALGGAAAVAQLLQVLLATRTFCPLCRTPVLAKKYCRKHRHSKSLLGSHRLRVAVAALLTGSFRCPYCGEPSMLEVRERGGYRADSRS